jgi:hypothetical protein
MRVKTPPRSPQEPFKIPSRSPSSSPSRSPQYSLQDHIQDELSSRFPDPIKISQTCVQNSSQIPFKIHGITAQEPRFHHICAGAMFPKASLNKLAPHNKHSIYTPNNFCTKQRRTCSHGPCSHEALRMPTKRDFATDLNCQTSFCEPASPRHWLQRAAKLHLRKYNYLSPTRDSGSTCATTRFFAFAYFATDCSVQFLRFRKALHRSQ